MILYDVFDVYYLPDLRYHLGSWKLGLRSRHAIEAPFAAADAVKMPRYAHRMV